ncbi:MAG: hypothetical protein KF799_02965 [Bdellovibrionales bacterium]|nr:hypothetical protein [Bdellovibrionales bacterium]
MMQNQRGLITVDFLFSLVLIMGMTGLLFVLTFSMSIAAVTQYVTFAAARNFVPSHVDQAAQLARAQAKYDELLNNPVLRPLYTGGWFTVDAQVTVGDLTQAVPAFGQDNAVNKFWGAGTNFTARILDFRIPFFGSTVPDGDGSGSGFKSYLSSSLGREPTSAECIEFTASRWTAIRNLQVSGGAAYSTGTGTQGYFPMTDDGC